MTPHLGSPPPNSPGAQCARENSRQTQLRDSLQNTWPVLRPTVKVTKHKGSLRNCPTQGSLGRRDDSMPCAILDATPEKKQEVREGRMKRKERWSSASQSGPRLGLQVNKCPPGELGKAHGTLASFPTLPKIWRRSILKCSLRKEIWINQAKKRN